jgi:hypothetical protein
MSADELGQADSSTRKKVHVIPVTMQRIVDGFRFARLIDGLHDDGTPQISEERGWITDQSERERILGYLTAGARVLHTNRAVLDVFDSHVPVRVGFRTDGVWVWAYGVEHYLKRYQIAPEPEFIRHIVAQDFKCPSVATEIVESVKPALLKRSETYERERGEYLRVHGLLPRVPVGDRVRFPDGRVNATLLSLGWESGRDVGESVDRWLERELPVFADAAFVRDGYPVYRPNEAARRVLCEFGGIRHVGGGRGVSAATSTFEIFPQQSQELGAVVPQLDRGDLTGYMLHVADLGRYLGKQLFQVGELERMAAIAVADDGAVYTTGVRNLLLGETIEAALRNMILGIQATPVS